MSEEVKIPVTVFSFKNICSRPYFDDEKSSVLVCPRNQCGKFGISIAVLTTWNELSFTEGEVGQEWEDCWDVKALLVDETKWHQVVNIPHPYTGEDQIVRVRKPFADILKPRIKNLTPESGNMKHLVSLEKLIGIGRATIKVVD